MKHALSVRSFFSMGESLMAPDDIAKRAKELGYESVALVDTMTVSSMIEFAKAADKSGLKQIVGCRLRVVSDPRNKDKEKKKPDWEFYPKVYVRNEAGLKDLFALLSKANSDEYFYYSARIGFDDLLGALKGGNLAFSTGDFHSILHRPNHIEMLTAIASAAGAHQTFVELIPIHTPLFDTLNIHAIRAANELQLPTLLTRPTLYAEDGDAETLEILSAITTNTKMSAPWRNQQYVKDFTFASPSKILQEAMAAKGRIDKREGAGFCGDVWKGAVNGMSSLVGLCEFKWSKQPVSLPKLVNDELGELVRLVKKGWAERLLSPTMGHRPSESDLVKYRERLAEEIGVLKNMGFENYFLVVADLVTWAKQASIMVGPGRGSVGGSLVAYLLYITDVDPLRFGLLFERFINPERLDLPDADLDFMSSRRQEVIQYLVAKYGEEQVAGISNYGTLASASALRDSARVFDLPESEFRCSKFVPKIHGKSHDLNEAADEVPEIDAFRQKYPDIWAHAVKLQGTMRSLGRHAAGVVVAGEPIVNRAVVERRNGEPTVNWDKQVVEDQGLIKMDILGLSTLDMLEVARQRIEERHKTKVDFTALPLDDPKVLQAFSLGDTVGVFQFESPGMRGLLRNLAVNGQLTFEHIAAATALYRPGPMDSGLMDDYIAIVQGHSMPSYEHPNMKPALEATDGVIVYQEQVMRLARDLAGFTMAGADHLRKAMGKKDPEKMAEQRQKWIDGCVSHSGMLADIAGRLFDKIEKFAGYAFNKSHAVEYSIISYWCQWTKVYYPAEFYAAALTIMDEDKLPGLVADAEVRNIFVIPPDINRSSDKFEIDYDAARQQTVLVTPFSRVKGCSDKTAQAILEARAKKGGPFEDQEDFLRHVNKTKCNKRVQEALDKVGAFAYFPGANPPARHPDRLRDQTALLPGLIIESIKADRKIEVDKHVGAKLIHLVNEVRACQDCNLAGGVHPKPRLGKSPRFMVITDSPNFGEEQNDKMMEGPASGYLREALSANNLSLSHAYFTSLVKSPKNEKQVTGEQINACAKHLKREIELLKPPIIVACGGATIRHLVPGVKGGFAELCGKSQYIAELDTTVIFGINPQMVYVDSTRQEMLNDVFAKVAQLVS